MRHTAWPSDADLQLSDDRDGRFAGGWGGGGNMGQGLAAQGDGGSAGNGSWGWRNWKGAGEGELGGGLSEARRREALQGQEWGSRGARLRARAAGEQSRRGVGGGGAGEQRAEVSRGEQGGEGASEGAAGSSGGGGGQQYGVQAVQREAWWTAFQRGAARACAPHGAPVSGGPDTAGRAVAAGGAAARRGQLRGWVSAVPYAVLSGRTLVRAHAAQHSRVLDTLCLAFHCAFPALQGPLSLAATAGQGGRAGSEGEREREAEEVMAAVRALDPMFFLEISDTPQAVAETVPSDYPLLATRAGTFFDAFWERSPPLRACVFAAFHCASLHCVRSKALFALLGAGPSPALLLATRSVLRGPAGSEGEEVGRAGAGDEGKSGGVGRKGGERAGAGRVAEQQTHKGLTRVGEAAPGQSTKRHLLSVGGKVARDGRGRGGGAAEQGEVVGEGAVWFDVAVHVRTRTLAVEKAVKPGSTDTQWQGCTDADAHPPASPFMQDCLWRCVLSTVALLAANSTTSTSSSSSSGSSGHADTQSVPSAGERGGRGVSVFVATDNEELRPAFVERLQRMEGAHVYWSAAAVRHTSKAGTDGQAGQGGLHGLADWWLLSRASAVLQVAHASSFAYFAALFANSTFASISTLNGRCDVHYEHIAEPVT
ncbi:unnamed protein product [Closterium sp. Yama58-4]|nr:unnamed protein product [Closterium sp. Yama58-4]